MSQGYLPRLVACGLEQPIACHQADACDIGQGEAAGVSNICPQILLPTLSCPDLSFFAVTSVPAGRFAWVSCLQVPSQSPLASPSEAGTLGSC